MSISVCSCLSSVPVRWNFGALLMIQWSFLCLSIYLLLIAVLLSAVASCQAWSPFSSKAEGQLCSLSSFSLHLLHTLLNALVTGQIELVSGVSPYRLTGSRWYRGLSERTNLSHISCIKSLWRRIFQKNKNKVRLILCVIIQGLSGEN